MNTLKSLRVYLATRTGKLVRERASQCVQEVVSVGIESA
jgi:hypothetical protein